MLGRPEEESRAEAEETDGPQSHADVGGKVSAILEAAEAAAGEIRQGARREALKIVQLAEKQAASQIEELTHAAARARADADDYARDVRTAVHSYGTQQRHEAEEVARRVVADAEEQARAMREAAEEMAEQIQRDAHQRHETLQKEVKEVEARRQRALEGLRDIAAQLEDVLVEPAGKARQDESLMDALDVERR
jgi:vacuolar-type H+-ATPase subunit E/Vma4